MFKLGKHQNVYSWFLNLFTNKKILFALLAVAIVAILIPTISFATEVMDAEGETLPEKVENAINEIIAEAPAPTLAAPSEDMSNYLCFTPAGADAEFTLNKKGNPIGKDVQYSTNGTEWTAVVPGNKIIFNGPVYLRGNNLNGFSSGSSDLWYFSFVDNKKVYASGSIMSLIDNGSGSVLSVPNDYCFLDLFQFCDALLSPPFLPAMELKSFCYSGMFEYCFSLKESPELPSKSLATSCYQNMFLSAHSLEVAPELPALCLCLSCYKNMFVDCGSLLKAPELPALVLAENCYEGMFSLCNFSQGPSALPAKELKSSCYESMFSDCLYLSEAPVMNYDKTAEGACANMFLNCYALTSAPEIPSAIPANGCYDNMFWWCFKLKRLTVNFNDWGSGTTNWLGEVPNAEDCVFVCPEDLQISERGASTIPDKWQIIHPMKLEVSDNSVVYDGLEHGMHIDTVYPADSTKEFSEDGSTWGSEIKKKDVGEYTIYCRISKADFDPIIASAKIIITPSSGASVAFDGGPYTKKYGDKDPDFKMNFLGLATGDIPVINQDYTISRDEGEDVLQGNATYGVYFNWLNPNYTIAPIQTTLTIDKAENAKLVADNYSRYSNESDPTKFPAHMEGLKYGDVLTDADYVVAKVSDENAETITLRPSLTPTGIEKFSNNYELDLVDGELNIYYSSDQPEFQFAVNADNCTYDGNEHEFKIDMISPQGLAKVEYSVDDWQSWQEEPFKFTEQGTQTVHYRINYTGYTEASGQADITIAPAQLTIVPDACYKNQGEADPTLTAQVYGLAEGESLVPGVDYTLTRAQGEEPGVYDIYCNVNNGKLGNYNVTTGTSKFIIASAGGNAENVEGNGASVAQTGDANAAIFITIAIIGLASAGYVLSRKLRKTSQG